MINIGPTIRALRIEKKLSLKQLAERSQTSSSYLCLIETGKQECSFYLLGLICKGLEVPLRHLCYLMYMHTDVALEERKTYLELEPALIQIDKYARSIHQSARV